MHTETGIKSDMEIEKNCLERDGERDREKKRERIRERERDGLQRK